MKEKLKWIIFVLVIICIILGILIIQLNQNQTNIDNENEELKQNTVSNNFTDTYTPEETDEIEQNMTLIKQRSDYKLVKYIVDEFLVYCNYLDSDKKEEGITNLRNILDVAYLNEYNYTDNDINSNFSKYANEQILIDKIYEKTNSNIKAFIVKGHLKSNSDAIDLLLLTDSTNNTFSILPQEYMNKYNYNEKNFTDAPTKNIYINGYNTYETQTVTEEEHIKSLLKHYMEKSLYCTELAYDYLNKEYKEAKFGSLEKYSEFIENNRSILELYDPKNIKQVGDFESYEEWNEYFGTVKLLEVEQYLLKERDGYTEYTIIDSLGNYYIFNEKSVMNYEVILDTYTIDIAQFIEKYDSADTEAKAEMNITRFLDSINLGDYKYSYSKLEEEFKEQYFPTIEEFAKYIDDTFIYFEEIECSEFSDLGGAYSFLVELTYDEKTMQKVITVEQREGRDYRISFDVM